MSDLIQTEHIQLAPRKSKTAQDWVRDMRMSSDVNKTTVGVETEQVTPDLLLATSKKLLGIARQEQMPDPKDSLEFQRFFGAAEYFPEHILRDGNKLGRNLLWKATNKGNLDFMQSNALEGHVSDVFNSSRLAQMIDGSSPLETVDAAYRTTRVGEGGVSDVDSAPDEMRTVQSSYHGFVDPVRSAERKRVGLDMYMTKHCMKGSDGKLYQKFINARTGKEELVDSVTAAKSVITTPEMMQANTSSIFALGGDTGVRIVPKESVDYYLSRSDDAYSLGSNMVAMFPGVKELRLLMGCLHPYTSIFVTGKNKETTICYAKDVKAGNTYLQGSEDKASALHVIRNTLAKFPLKQKWFKKVVLRSGRTLVTSVDHKWPVVRNGKSLLVEAQKLKKGDIVLRASYDKAPYRRTFYQGTLCTPVMGYFLGVLCRGLVLTDDRLHFSYPANRKTEIQEALMRFHIREYSYYNRDNTCFISIKEPLFVNWVKTVIGADDSTMRVPSIILSASDLVAAYFIDGYTGDKNKVGIDCNEDIWILYIQNSLMRDCLAYLLSRIHTDTLYRDTVLHGSQSLALKLTTDTTKDGDFYIDHVKSVVEGPQASIMIDIDINDNCYTVGNGILTHNSKYPMQAVSITGRETPLVRNIDEATGKDMATVAGRYLGALFAPKSGIVQAVRQDRIDVLYKDGTKGSIDLYKNFPMNAKGYIDNTPVVKAGQAFKEGDVLASSNYTDSKGVSAIGTNLRSAWISWKGGTYEDAVVISESAAKKLSSTTMYKTDIDLDKTITLGKKNYISWKPSEYTAEQMKQLDDNGVVKPGSILVKGDPMILAVQTTAPSPGTLGKRVLTDLSETWEHDHPGVVTDVVKTRKGVRVFATVTAPAEVGDKISGCFDDRTEVFTDSGFKLFKDLTETDKVAILHPDGTASFEVPLEYQTAPYKGCMIEVRSDDASMLVTPGHQVAFVPEEAYENGSKTLIKRTASDIYGTNVMMRIKAAFNSRCTDSCQYADKSAVRFLGLYIAAGSLSDNHRILLSPSNNDEDTSKQIEDILNNIGLCWTRADGVFTVDNSMLYALISDSKHNAGIKSIPEYVFHDYSREDIEALLEGYYIGTGSMADDNLKYTSVTTNKQLAQDIQRLCLLAGHYSVIREVTDSSCTMYEVTDSCEEFVKYDNWKIIDDYDGIVYCVTTSTGVILTRRDGIPCWNGQSYGNKSEISQILPDDQMPLDAKGRPLELLLSPLGLLTRTNESQIFEAMLAKIAKKTGTPEVLPAFFNGDMWEYVNNRLKQAHIAADEDLTDPDTGKVIKDVVSGYSYFYKLKHLAESKMSARGTSTYTAEQLPGGSGFDGSKRFGSLEQGALVGHNAFEVIKDAKLLRGQSNADFWRTIRTGEIPVMPGEPLVHRKFFAHLTGSGVNVRKTQKGISCFALSNQDVMELTGPRELKTRDTYEAKNFRPIDGGLFGQDIFGINGDKWAYIQLDEPMPNPVMEEPLSRLLRIPEKDFVSVVSGKAEVNGMKNASDVKTKLASMDLEKEAAIAKQELKDAPMSKKDNALKRYVAIERMRRLGVSPDQYMLDRIPVLPPEFRPVSTHSGLTMVADSNYLYAQLLDARDDMREAKSLPVEYQQSARQNLYRTWKELTGLYEPENVQLKNKHVRGLLKWALGDSPKWSAIQRKVIGATVDTVGRGVIIPNPRIKLNQVGIPKDMAFGIMAPIVERALVKRGYTPIDAMKQVKQQTQQATEILVQLMKEYPVLMNRAPSLHKLNVMAFEPVMVAGHAIHVNPSIVVPFAADFDGDTIGGLWSIRVERDEFIKSLKKFCISGKKFFISSEIGLYYNKDTSEWCQLKPNNEEKERLTKNQKARFSTAVISPADLPVVPGSAVKKSQTVTEWDVLPGIYVDTIGLNGERSVAPVTKVSKHTKLHMYDVALSVCNRNNYVITASDDHSLITINRETLELEKTKPADAVGRLVPRMRTDTTATAKYCSRYITLDKQYPAGYDLGVFLGVMLGDGWVNTCNATYIACCNPSLQAYLVDLINNKLGLPLNSDAAVFSYAADAKRFSQNDSQRISVHLVHRCAQALRTAIGDGAWNKHIPAECLTASHAHMTGLLMGMLATDGTVSYAENTAAKKSKCKTIILHTISPELRDGLQVLCSRLGIRTSVTPYEGKHSKRTCYAVSLSVVDVARECKHHPELFRIPMMEKQAALEKICSDLSAHASGTGAVSGLVPFPAALGAEFSWAKVGNASVMSNCRKQGYIELGVARRIADTLRSKDWSTFKEYEGLPRALKRGHTPEQAKMFVDKWCSIVDNADKVAWMHVDSVTESDVTEGWDCTVPGPYTFTLWNGLVVQDTVNIHVPISDQARNEARTKMFPERNLIGIRSREILYKPEKEYNQGLYIMTRQKAGAPKHTFETMEDAKAAVNKGLIDVDDPIIIKNINS